MPKLKLKKSIITLMSIVILFIVTIWIAQVQAQPNIIETGWTLIRTINFENPQAAHYNPLDDNIYVGKIDGIHKINQRGFPVKIASASGPAGILIDPDDGDIFFSEDTAGEINRIAFGGTTSDLWVSVFHGTDADPAGMAIAPNNYSGSVLAPGDALVVDWGNSGPDNVWRWSPDSPGGETLIHDDDGTLARAVDITIGVSDLYLVDGGGSIYQLLDDTGSLTPFTTSEVITNPLGITIDPITGDLLVLDAGNNRIVRVDIASGAVNDMFTGFSFASSNYAGIDVKPDGTQIIITDKGGNAIYVFGQCDATTFPEEDCNNNGIRDFCDIALDPIADCDMNGILDECEIFEDCDGNGIPDDCSICPSVELVFIMDTSSSMSGEGGALCDTISEVVSALQGMGFNTEVTLLAVWNASPSGCGTFSCLTDTVENKYGIIVPENPPPGLETLGNCLGGTQVACEDWGLATAIVAGLHPWSPTGESLKIIVPMADEGPWCGNPITQEDEDATSHAIKVAQNHDIIISPITGSGSGTEVINFAIQMADATGGSHFQSTDPDSDIAAGIINLVNEGCQHFIDCNNNDVPDLCDIPPICEGIECSFDENEDGVPDECQLTFTYSTDFLEIGNLGGVTSSFKTFEDEWWMEPSTQTQVDIWIDNAPEPLISGGFWLTYDPPLVSIVDVNVYDGDLDGSKGNPSPCCPGLPGPWDPNLTTQEQDPDGPGTYLVACANFAAVPPDTDQDIILARVTLQCEQLGDTPINILTIPTFDTVVGDSLTVYDPQISTKNVMIHQVEICDADLDGIPDCQPPCPPCPPAEEDNCPTVPNGPNKGSCMRIIDDTMICTGVECLGNGDCGFDEICQMNQENTDGDVLGDVCDSCPHSPDQTDSFPPFVGNGIGDACDCEGNFDCDVDVDGTDAGKFKTDFGRSQFLNPCESVDPCNGDFDCDGDCDGTDAALFKRDFGRSRFINPCPCCVVGEWCTYPAE